MADFVNLRKLDYSTAMSEKLHISLSPGQFAWIKARKEEGFATASDVVRDLIRRQQKKERAVLAVAFEKLQCDGSRHSEPVEAIMKVVTRVKKQRRETNHHSCFFGASAGNNRDPGKLEHFG
jgi:hypothetical protein